jgi:hypothetical protein
LDVELKTEVDAEVLSGEFEDESCNGTGKVSLNTWVLVKGLKDDLHKVSETQNKFRAPFYIAPDIEDEMIMDEFN